MPETVAVERLRRSLMACGYAAAHTKRLTRSDAVALPSVEDVRVEVKQWLEENWNPELTVAEWWDILARSGYAAPHFPEDCWGNGWPRDLCMAVSETIAAQRAVGPPA